MEIIVIDSKKAEKKLGGFVTSYLKANSRIITEEIIEKHCRDNCSKTFCGENSKCELVKNLIGVKE